MNISQIKLKFVLTPILENHNDSFKLENETFFAFFVGKQFFDEYESPNKFVVSSIIDKDFNVVGEFKCFFIHLFFYFIKWNILLLNLGNVLLNLIEN